MNVSDLPNRIADKIQLDPATGCWLWTNNKNRKGYGTVRFGKSADGIPVTAYAHRVVYHLLVDEDFVVKGGRSGQQLDHVRELCLTGPSCVNPSHLEPVTNRTNTARGRAGALKANAASRYVGVTRSGTGTRWRVYSIAGRARHYLGTFTTEIEAATAYDDFCFSVEGNRPNAELGLLPDAEAAA